MKAAVQEELPVTGAAVVKSGEPPRAPVIHAPEGKVSMTALLQLAVEKGLPVEQMEVLARLHDRARDREAAEEFARAMSAFQQECPPITHSKKAKITTTGGGSYSYTYAELDAIARVINPICAKHGLSYSWNMSVDEKNRLTCECVVRHLNGHIAPPSTFTLPIDNKSAMSEQQKVGAAATFAKRQTLIAALGITTSDDDFDGAAQVDPTPITEDQATHLEDQIAETQTDLRRFLKHFEIAKVADLPRVQYKAALAVLDQKKARAR